MKVLEMCPYRATKKVNYLLLAGLGLLTMVGLATFIFLAMVLLAMAS
jgi:hypothetical protein